MFLGWSDLDQDKALAWRREQAKCCRDCGTRKSQWAEDKFAFVGHIETCPGCELLEAEQEHAAQEKERGSKGLKVSLIPKWMYEENERNAEAAAKAKAMEKGTE